MKNECVYHGSRNRLPTPEGRVIRACTRTHPYWSCEYGSCALIQEELDQKMHTYASVMKRYGWVIKSTLIYKIEIEIITPFSVLWDGLSNRVTKQLAIKVRQWLRFQFWEEKAETKARASMDSDLLVLHLFSFFNTPIFIQVCSPLLSLLTPSLTFMLFPNACAMHTCFVCTKLLFWMQHWHKLYFRGVA